MSDEPQMPGLDALLSQAMEMQQQVMAAQAEAAEQEVSGVAGGGAVEIVVTGAMEFRDVRISPAAVDPDDVELLEDLVLAALRDAAERVNGLQAQSLGGFGDLLGGSSISDLLGEPGSAVGELGEADPGTAERGG
jgi:nucleoid-associated protein EbfC